MIIFPGQGEWLDILDEIKEGRHSEMVTEVKKLYSEEDGIKKAACYIRDSLGMGMMDCKKLAYSISTEVNDTE